MRVGLLIASIEAVAWADTCDPSTYEVNIAYSTGSEHILGTKKAADADECCALCAEDASCRSWTFSGGSCKMRDTEPGEGRKKNKGHTSGPGNNAPPSPPTPPPPTPPPTPSSRRRRKPTPSPTPSSRRRRKPTPTPTPPPTPPAPIPKDKPNFVLVLTDDQDALLNGYDPAVGVAHMKNLNTLVRSEGALFTRYYDAYALCSPSRSTILTGRYPHNTGFQNNAQLKRSGFHPVQERDTLNVWLNRTGYHTMLCGKYMNGYHGNKYETYLPDGWGHFYGFQTLDYFGSRVNMNGPSYLYPKDAYQTDIIANLSLNWLRKEWIQERPFFMMLTPHAPHDPHTPAPRHLGKLAGLVQPPNPAFNLADDLQKLLPKGLDTLKMVKVDKMNKKFQARAEQLLAVDEMIGGIVNELKSMDVLEKTYIIFTSDNGYHLGQHRLPDGKRLFFEHDINLPLIIRGPGIAKGKTIHDMVGNYDYAPTIAELAGAKPTNGAPAVDGLSWAALVKGERTAAWPRSLALNEGFENAEGGVKCCGKYHALRIRAGDQDALYVETGSGEPAYFDNAADPYQTTNIIGNLSKGMKARLTARLASVKSCVGQQCVLASSVQGLLV